MIIGMIRYAVPTMFKKGNSKTAEQLYEEPYFSDRFNLFCNITLESFKQQTNKDFILLLYHSNQIPENRKILFDNLEKEYSFIKNIYISDTNMYIPESYKKDKILTFRIDNDDGVPIDFIERLKNIEETNNENLVISIPKIRKIIKINENQYKTVSINYLSNSIGLACLRIDGKNIIDLGFHELICKRNKTIKLEGNGGLQIINNYNVSNEFSYKVKDEQEIILSKEEIEKFLIKENYPKIDISCL